MKARLLVLSGLVPTVPLPGTNGPGAKLGEKPPRFGPKARTPPESVTPAALPAGAVIEPPTPPPVITTRSALPERAIEPRIWPEVCVIVVGVVTWLTSIAMPVPSGLLRAGLGAPELAIVPLFVIAP